MTARNQKFVSVCSFIALLIGAVLLLLVTICKLEGNILEWLKIVKDFTLLIGIGVPAFGLIRNAHPFWKVLYWVLMAIYIFCIAWQVFTVLGIKL